MPALRRDARTRGRRVRLQAIAPDANYSLPGRTRILHYSRPPGAFAVFDRDEFLVPTEQAASLCRALLGGEVVPASCPYRVASEVRDVFVCTDGARDTCCGAFGYPVYRALRAREPTARIWRTSHLGGDRFAPTALTMPDARAWAHLDVATAVRIADRVGTVDAVAPHYRGWCGLRSPYAQVAEREAFVRHGWGWLRYRTSGEVVRVDEQAGRADVRIEFRCPEGTDVGAYEATVEIARRVPDSACGRVPDGTSTAPEYRIVRFTGATPIG